MSSTLHQEKTGVSREELVGKLIDLCRESGDAKPLCHYLRDYYGPQGNCHITLVRVSDGVVAILTYPRNDLSLYGEEITTFGICGKLPDVARELGLKEILFYSMDEEKGLGRGFLNTEVGMPVYGRDHAFNSFEGTVVEII